MASAIPIEVKLFVQAHIHSLDQLEVLLLVSSFPNREWTTDAVYCVVLSSPTVVEERLEGFVAAGLLVRSGAPASYRYAPATEELTERVSALGAAYSISRHKIVELIYSAPPSDPLKDFSEAFRFKRNP